MVTRRIRRSRTLARDARRWLVVVATALCSSVSVGVGCLDTGASPLEAGAVLPSEAPFGPRVVYDPLRRPIPEVPFPNDGLLARDGEGLGGLVWNVSERAPTQLERDIRGRLNQLRGFGPFTPITVAFDGPLLLGTVRDDSVIVVNIEPGHPREGERVPLDLGGGAYPLDGRGAFWPFDPKADLPDFLLPADNDAEHRGETRRVTHYEVETDTLILRPLVPLAPGARHAVLLTRQILGTSDLGVTAPVRSPFPYKAHASQSDLVARARELVDMDASALAFGWTFTTYDPLRPFVDVRDGLYGEGPLARLAEGFPAELGDVRHTGIHHDADGVEFPADARDHPYILQGDFLASVLGLIASVADGFEVSFEHIDYVAFGSLRSPDLRTGDGGALLGVDPASGEGEVGEGAVPYLIAVPKASDDHQPPFPVVFYFHGTGTSRFEFLALGDDLARQGIATIAFDAVGHGPLIPDVRLLLAESGIEPGFAASLVPILAALLAPERVDDFEGLSFEEGFDKLTEIGFFAELATIGRTEDRTGDGALESGESFFYADPFKQCASFFQGVVDLMQFVRVVRAFDPGAVPPAIDDPEAADPERLLANLRAGDLNADGVLDIGGPDVSIGLAGTSLGGIHAVLAGAVEPEVTTITPIAAGGGLTDILLRSRLRQITEVIYLEVFGPLVVGCPDGEGGVWLSFNDASDGCRADLGAVSFDRLAGVGAGAVVTVTNLANGQLATRELTEDGEGFALAVESDRWDLLEIVVTRPGGDRTRVRTQTPVEGLALERNTPELRRFISITQSALDACDPVGFAPRLFLDPPPGHAPKRVLFDFAIGDRTVPISTGVALARAAGVFGADAATWRPALEALIDVGVLAGADYDVDDVTGDNPPEAPALGPLAPVPSGDGWSAARFADVDGRHEWIAGGDPESGWDAATFSRSRIAIFHRSGGDAIIDDPCLAEPDCPLLDPP